MGALGWRHRNRETRHGVWREALWGSAGKHQMALFGKWTKDIGRGDRPWIRGHWLCIERRHEIEEETLGLEEERSGSLRPITSGSFSGGVCDAPAMILGLSVL